MALPVTLTSATFGAQNSYHAPFKSSGGGFYVITISPTATDQIAAWKADNDDPTDAFTVQDSSAEPDTAASAIQTLWTDQKDDIIYVAVQTAVEDVYHAQFDMAANAWVEITTGNTQHLVVDLAAETQADAVSIAVRGGSTGEIVIAYQGNPSTNKDMGDPFNHIVYAISTDSGVGASWSIGNVVADKTTGASVVDYTGPVIVRGTGTLGSERIHFFFKDITNNDAYQRTLAGSLETFPSAFDDTTALSPNDYLFGNGVLLDDVVYVPFKNDDVAQLSVAHFLSADTPVVTVDTSISDGSVNFGPSLSLDGSDIHAVFPEGVSDDVYHNVNTGSGWAADDDLLFAGTGDISIASSNIYDRDGPKIGIVYNDAGTVKYNEEPITHTFGLLSDVKMGKQNSFHGPFET